MCCGCTQGREFDMSQVVVKETFGAEVRMKLVLKDRQFVTSRKKGQRYNPRREKPADAGTGRKDFHTSKNRPTACGS